jgi:hypothetical protein
MWHVWERREMNTGFWRGNMKERDHVEEIRHRWEENIKTGWEDVDWLRLVGGRNKWRTLYKHGSNNTKL